MVEVAVELEGVLIVGAVGLLVETASGVVESATLVFVVEAEESADAEGKDVVGLVVELVAVVDVVEGGRDESGLTGGGVAVGTAEGDDVAVVDRWFDDSVDDGGRLIELLLLFALASDAVAG